MESISIQYFYSTSNFLLTQEEEVNLGTKDSKAKEYLSDNTRFSEICNYVLFDGEKVIKPEDLGTDRCSLFDAG